MPENPPSSAGPHESQAMLTRKLGVKGNMAVMMRNVPTVLDFVRCAGEVTDEAVERVTARRWSGFTQSRFPQVWLIQ